MTPEETAEATAAGTGQLTSHFMLDGATYVKGAELGFEGMTFYVSGRGGVLGEVVGDVVAACFVFFEPTALRAMWEQGLDAMPPLRAAEEFAGCLHRWADEHVPDTVACDRLAALAGKVSREASVAGAPMFAAWRALPEPLDESPKALALHRMNGLRELRNAYHGAAVIAAGLTPMEAVVYRQPHMAPLFGWPEPYPDPESLAERWERAEALTNAMMGRALAVLDEDERVELVEVLAAVQELTSQG